MQWADNIVWESLLKFPQTDGDEKIKDLLFHLHMVQHAYLHIWTKETFKPPFQSDFKDIASIRTWGEEYYHKTYPIIDAFEESSLNNELKIPWIKFFLEKMGKEPSMITLGESILQVAMHSNYHRGQINLRLRELGGEPQLVDFIYWALLGKPEPGH
jgi:uncharacterized damage-inducible protein DinB